MFFSQRSHEVEYFDRAECSKAETSIYYEWLERLNVRVGTDSTYLRHLPKIIGETECRRLSILDLGAGNGSLGIHLCRRAVRRGWSWDATNLDTNVAALSMNRSGQNVGGSVTALPFADASFDVVIASTMTHHLETEAEVARHFQEAARVAKRAILICDLYRNAFFAAMLCGVLRLVGCPRMIRSDAWISIHRGWRVGEWKSLARQAGLMDPRVSHEGWMRILLTAIPVHKAGRLVVRENPAEMLGTPSCRELNTQK